MFINREKFSVQPPIGKKLGGWSKTDPFDRISLATVESGKATITLSQQMRFERSAVRGLFKIALETIAYFHGLDAVMSAEFDPVRDYVIRNKGDFGAVLLPGGSFDGHFGNPFRKDGKPHLVPMTILQLGFICDFDPTFSSGVEIIEGTKKMRIGANRLPNY